MSKVNVNNAVKKSGSNLQKILVKKYLNHFSFSKASAQKKPAKPGCWAWWWW